MTALSIYIVVVLLVIGFKLLAQLTWWVWTGRYDSDESKRVNSVTESILFWGIGLLIVAVAYVYR